MPGVELNPYESPTTPPALVHRSPTNQGTDLLALGGLLLGVLAAVVVGLVATRSGGLAPAGNHGTARLILVTCSTVGCVALIAWLTGRYYRRTSND
jgi:hypothetical protein